MIELHCCAILTSIAKITDKSDLIGRFLMIELEDISEEERKDNEELRNIFNADLPDILGIVYKVLQQLLIKIETVKVEKPPRMATWTKYGFAIAGILGIGGENFVRLYKNNIEESMDELIEEETEEDEDDLNESGVILDLVQKLLSDPESNHKWSGTMKELLTELNKLKSGYYGKFPLSASSLSGKLKKMKGLLNDNNIYFLRRRTAKGKRIVDFEYREFMIQPLKKNKNKTEG